MPNQIPRATLMPVYSYNNWLSALHHRPHTVKLQIALIWASVFNWEAVAEQKPTKASWLSLMPSDYRLTDERLKMFGLFLLVWAKCLTALTVQFWFTPIILFLKVISVQTKQINIAQIQTVCTHLGTLLYQVHLGLLSNGLDVVYFVK